jgi:NADH-quinone oxidoreductase subunit E
MMDRSAGQNLPDETIIAPFKGVRGGLLPALQAIDAEYHTLPEETLIKLSETLNIPVAQVFGVATFYAKFTVDPRGRGQNIIRFCKSAPCHIAGAAKMIAALEQHLGIKTGETTPDGKFTLELTECIGRCQSAPVFTINEQPYFAADAAAIPEILAGF